MDPEVTAKRIVELLNQSFDSEEPIEEFTELRVLLDDLEMWIHNGGFTPSVRFQEVPK